MMIEEKNENKSIVRIIMEMLKEGNTDLILKNPEMFFETEKLQLELSYLNGISDFSKKRENFTDYYIRTYLKEFASALNIKTNKENEQNTVSCQT